MSKKYCILLLIGCIVASFILSGCTETQSPDQSTQDTQDQSDFEENDQTGSITVPVYPNTEIPPFTEPSLWTDFHVSDVLTRATYFSDATVEDIYEWYEENIGEWSLHKRSLTKDPEQQSDIVLGEIYLQHENTGAYILIMKVEEGMPISTTSILGIAQGDWSLVQSCGTTESGEDPHDIGTGPVAFSMTPLAEDEYSAINPLGSVSGGGHSFPTDHGSFWFSDPDTYPPPYTVFAPAEGIITEILYREVDWPTGSGHSGTYSDYRIRLEHTNTFRSFIGHISTLDESLLEQTGSLSIGDNQFFESPIAVNEGDVLGKAGGRPNAEASMTWWVVDEEITLDYIHTERYDQFAHAAHFIEYCDEQLQASLIQKLGSGPPYHHTRTAEPLWGKIDFDQLEHLVGNWFHEDINEDDPMAEFEKHLSFVYSLWDPSTLIIGVGGTLSIEPTVYEIDGNSPDFADVSQETGSVVYHLQGTAEYGEQSLQATILVEVIEDEKIMVEGFSGWQSSPSFTSNAQYYIR